MSDNKCPKCGKSYGSSAHAQRCRGLTGASLRQWRNARNASRRGHGASGGRGFSAASVLSWIPINTDALPGRMAVDAQAGVELQAVRS